MTPQKFKNEPYKSVYPIVLAKVEKLACILEASSHDKKAPGFTMLELKQALVESNPSVGYLMSSTDLGHFLGVLGYMKIYTSTQGVRNYFWVKPVIDEEVE